MSQRLYQFRQLPVRCTKLLNHFRVSKLWSKNARPADPPCVPPPSAMPSAPGWRLVEFQHLIRKKTTSWYGAVLGDSPSRHFRPPPFHPTRRNV
jgi:hypothetical protein